MTETINLLATSGNGPEECRIALRHLLDVMKAEAAKAGVSLQVVEASHKPSERPRSAIVTLAGDQAPAFAARFCGSIRVIFKSTVRQGHKRKNWYVGVERLDHQPLDEGDPGLDSAEVRFETLRAGGPGGQHQNTTDSAVRAVHLPTGLMTLARDERSQHRNKALALQRLATMLRLLAQDDAERNKHAVFKSHRSLERGNEVMTLTL